MAARPAPRTLRWLGVALLAALLAWFFFRRPDEGAQKDLIVRAARSLAKKPDEDAARTRARLDRELGPLLTPDVRVSVPGLDTGVGREGVLRAAATLSRNRQPTVQVEHLVVRSTGQDSATAEFDAVVSDSQVGDLHADSRRVRARLRRVGAAWLIEELSATPEERAEPEARP